MINTKIQVSSALRRLLLIIVIVFIAGSTGVAAHDKDDKPTDQERAAWNREMRQAKADFISRELELDEATKAKFRPLYENMDKELGDLGEQTRRMTKNIREKGKKATDLEIEKAAEARFELRGRENAIEMKYFKEFKKVLTPQQLFRLKDSERKFNRKLMKEHTKATERKK